MLPRVVMHNLMSLDGRLDFVPADVGLYYELAARWKVNAILSGSGTVLAAADQIASSAKDSEASRSKDPRDRRPLLVVPDSRGRVRDWMPWLDQPYWRDVVVLCSDSTPGPYLRRLERDSIDTIVVGKGRADMRRALEELNSKYAVRNVRLDSGGTLNGVLLRAGLVDEVSVLVHPALVGGTSPSSVFTAPDLSSASGVVDLKIKHVEKLRSGYVWLRYTVVR
ncbi:MAG: RibD family protein [Thermoplasmata archaeon]|jgi:2,5-diamino-6-(ribosylamino)-4(3H)-pyrimidinone 5'-phosphate reductase|nr:RibD family protein [Thermoplasmata archaeon]